MGFPLAGPDDDISELLSRDLLQQHSEDKGYHFSAFSKAAGPSGPAYGDDPSHSIIDQMWDQSQPSSFLDHPLLPSGPIPLPYRGDKNKARKAGNTGNVESAKTEAAKHGTGETARPRMPDNLLVADDDDSQENDPDDRATSSECFFDDDEELDADAPLFLQPGDPDKIRQLRK